MTDQPTLPATIDAAARSHGVDTDAMQRFVLDGDLSSIPPPKRASLYVALCAYIGVDPIERPFLIFRDGKREVLYAARSCTSALCRARGISREILGLTTETLAGHETIVAKARATIIATGRHDEATGAVPVLVNDMEWDEQARRKVSKGWRKPTPDEVSNAVMKAETKAKRRAVLDLVGLGIPDESELATIKGARTHSLDLGTGEIIEVGATDRAPAAAVSEARVGMPTAEELTSLRADVARLAAAWGLDPKAAWGDMLRRCDLPAKVTSASLSRVTHDRLRAEVNSALAELDSFDADAREIAADLEAPPETADLVRTVEAVREAFPGTTEVGKAPAKARRSKGDE